MTDEISETVAREILAWLVRELAADNPRLSVVRR